METLYRRVEINGDPERLPKEDIWYYGHATDTDEIVRLRNEKHSDWTYVDWYFSPVPRSEIIEVLKKHVLNREGINWVIYTGQFEQIADEIIGGK